MRASIPISEGTIARAGVALHYEVHGTTGPVVFLLPAWSIVHGRVWKLQVADLSRDHRVLVMDGRGNGRSGRPTDPSAYTDAEFALDFANRLAGRIRGEVGDVRWNEGAHAGSRIGPRWRDCPQSSPARVRRARDHSGSSVATQPATNCAEADQSLHTCIQEHHGDESSRRSTAAAAAAG